MASYAWFRSIAFIIYVSYLRWYKSGSENIINVKPKYEKSEIWVMMTMAFHIVTGEMVVLTQKSTHWNPRASVRRVMESQPSVPVNLTWNWQGRKQSQIRERIGWDSEYLSDGRISIRYYRWQKDIKCKRVVNERIGRISRYTKRQNRLWTADRVCMTRSKLRMCSSDDVKLKTDLNRLLR